MKPARSALFVLSLAFAAATSLPPAQASFNREFDLIYHKQDGFALTMERITPTENGTGVAIVMVMSGGWVSNHEFTRPHDATQLPDIFKPIATELLERGYTLFYVVHGTQPKFTIREIHGQIDAGVRHIRQHAPDYRIDPGRIGILGGSAGGHLALMQGTRGADAAGEDTQQPSSRVQAVVAYFPPTDFLNYGNDGVFFDKVVRTVIADGGNPFLQALDYYEYDASTIRLTRVTDPERLAQHYRDIAPRYHVTSDDAPTLLLHGDKDTLVPLQQSELIMSAFRKAQVPCELLVKQGGEHGWPATADEANLVADWYDRHLAD